MASDKQPLEEATGEGERGIWQQSGAKSNFQCSKNLKSTWKKGMMRSRPTTSLTTLSVSFHKSVDFAGHALKPTDINVDISTQMTKLLAQHPSGTHQSKSHSRFPIFRAELGLLIARNNQA